MAARKKSRTTSKKGGKKAKRKVSAKKKATRKKAAKKKATKKKATKKKVAKRSKKTSVRKVSAADIKMPSRNAANRFGTYVRAVRLAEGLRLRRVSEDVGMSPAYLSMVERGELDPPTRNKIVALAKALGQDQDALLALAGKVSEDIPVLMLRHPTALAAILRTTRSMSKDKIDKLLAQAKKLKR